MKVINQTKKNTCLACVLAMLVDESEGYVIDWFAPHITPPIGDDDAFIFLAHHGIYLASYAFFYNDAGEKGCRMYGDETYTIKYNLSETRAYICVNSPSCDGLTHAVFWNGREVLDPLKKEPQKLSSYTVRNIYPMMSTHERRLNKPSK